MVLPDFLLIGAPKAGTTALHAALKAHPALFLPAVKEPKFFLRDGRRPPRQTGPGDAHSAREWVWRRDRYEALFAGAPPGALTGESTPLYLYDRRAHERLRRTVPDAKLVALLRDPVDRAHSNWLHLWSDGLEPIGDFVEACRAEDERPFAPDTPRTRPRLSPAERREVLDPLREDLERLERVTGRSFADWLGEEGAGEFSARRRPAEPEPA
jgi:hypothetical protein